MDEKQELGGVGEDCLQELLIAFRGEAALNALREQASGEICNGPKDFVPFALATGGDFGLLTPARPSVTQGAPLGKADLILKQA